MEQKVLQLMTPIRNHGDGSTSNSIKRRLCIHVCRRTKQRGSSNLAQLRGNEIGGVTLPFIRPSNAYLDYDVLALQLSGERAREHVHKGLRGGIDIIQRIAAGHDSSR